MERVLSHLKGRFAAGLFVVIPLGITIFILRFLFNFADGILGPYLARAISATFHGSYIPGLGMVTVALLIYATGLLATNVIGRHLLRWWETVLVRIPLVKPIYSASKQLIQVFREGKGGYRRAVFVEWPRPGVRAIGFVTATAERAEGKFLVVYIPTMPNPTSGFALLFREEDVEESGMTVEDAVKFVVSGGVVVPPSLAEAALPRETR